MEPIYLIIGSNGKCFGNTFSAPIFSKFSFLLKGLHRVENMSIPITFPFYERDSKWHSSFPCNCVEILFPNGRGGGVHMFLEDIERMMQVDGSTFLLPWDKPYTCSTFFTKIKKKCLNSLTSPALTLELF